MQINEISVKAKDGAYVPVVTYNLGMEPVKGIIIISHGFGEHAGSYKEFADRLKQANYATVVFDQRGHGHLGEQFLEKRKKLCGIIPSYQSFLDDIDVVTAEMKQKTPNTPLVLYGHSMGGNIAANYLLKHNQSDFSCAVLEAPWLGLHKEVSPLVACMAKIWGRITPKIAIIKELPLSDITSDKKKAKEIENDPLYHNRISLRMFSGIKDGCAYAISNASQISIPTYLAIALEEKIVSNQAIQDFEKACASNVTSEKYESHHSIHNDRNRETFYHDIIAFFDVHCSTVQTI